MNTFLLAGENLPFTVALTVMLAIAVLEGVTSLLGMGISEMIDSVLPDIEFDIDAPDIDDPGVMTRFLGWLRVGEVPLLMLLVIFLTAFGLLGLALQAAASDLFGTPLPAMLAAIIVILPSLPLVRGFGGLLARIMPKDESEAVSSTSFIGRVAVITTGTARSGSPAEAKLKDRYGHTHYVMVEPDAKGEVFESGSEVLLVSRDKVVFRGIANPSSALSDEPVY